MEPNRSLRDYERSSLRHPAVRLNHEEREVVLEVIRNVCHHEGWFLHAAHVRSNHAHIVVSARTRPEPVMKKLKAYASRELNNRFGQRERRWTRHGSTSWIWRREMVDSAVDYVVQRQGKPMSCYENPNRWQEFLNW